MVIHVSGKNLNSKKIDRAVSLSHEKYCSVYNSLRKDIVVRVKYALEEESPDLNSRMPAEGKGL
jgi:uncharacterized OsmC-like protein